MIFGVLNSERHQQLVHLPTSPVYCSHFTLGNPRSRFSTVLFIRTSDYLHSVRRKTNCYFLTHHTWKMSLHYLVKGALTKWNKTTDTLNYHCHSSLFRHYYIWITNTIEKALGEWLSESQSTHNRSFQRRVFPDNRLHWYWQPKTIKQNTTYTPNTKYTEETQSKLTAGLVHLLWHCSYKNRALYGQEME